MGITTIVGVNIHLFQAHLFIGGCNLVGNQINNERICLLSVGGYNSIYN